MKESTIDSRIHRFVSGKEMMPRYLKNIVLDICHHESSIGIISKCQICGKRAAKYKPSYTGKRYGYRFAQFYNKRHQTRDSFDNKYFSGQICMDCVGEIEKLALYKFEKSFAP